LGKRLPEKGAAALAKTIVAAMQKEKVDAEKLSALGRALGSLGERLRGEDAAAGAKTIAAAMQNEKVDAEKLSALGGALGSLGERLRGEDAAAGAKAIREAMQIKQTAMNEQMRIKQRRGSDIMALGKALGSLGGALGGLGARLTEEDAKAGAKVITDAMQTEEVGADNLAVLGEAFVGFGKRLPVELAGAGAKAIMKAMEVMGNDDPYARQRLATVLARLGGRIESHSDKVQIAENLIAAVPRLAENDYLQQFTKLIHPLETNDLDMILKHPLCLEWPQYAVLKELEKTTRGVFHDTDYKYRLVLGSAGNDTTIEKRGERLVIVAKVGHELTFRFFDADSGFTNWSEEGLPPSSGDDLDKLKAKLALWEGKDIPETQEKEIKAIVETLLNPLQPYYIWMFVEKGNGLGLVDLNSPPTRPSPATRAGQSPKSGR
jgi:hypothetical protein